MGTMRTLLAISVLITHSAPIFGIRLLGGDTAVLCFFIISGFLITLILNEKYQDLKAFYVNRGLRIYVPYWSALALSFVLYLFITRGAHDPDAVYVSAIDQGQWSWVLWSTISNLTLVGIDLTRYIGIDAGVIVFPTFLHDVPTAGDALLFVPQAWTLAIELQFYLVAPLLVRLRAGWVFFLAALLLVIRSLIFEQIRADGIPIDDTAIFPMMLGYFMLGAAAYHAFRWWRAIGVPERAKRVISAVAWVASLLLVFKGLDLLQRSPRTDYDLFFLAIAATLPLTFYLTKDWKWDSRVGDYSYPIYVFHFIISAFVTTFLVGVPQPGLCVLLITIGVSAVFLRFIDAPVQRLRRRIAARGLKPEAAAA